MNKKLLFITHHKLNENNGGSNGSKGFLHCFAALFDDCTVLCPPFEGSTAPYIPEAFSICFIENNRSNARKLLDMYRGIISPLYNAVRKHLSQHRYDVIVIDHSFSGAGISGLCKATGAKVITIHHNVERDYLRDNSKERPWFYRFPFLYYSRKAERDCLKNSDVNLTVTERDAAVFRSWYPNIRINSWGIFEYQFLPDKQFVSKSKGQVFVITGSLYFEQSIHPIIEFVQRYWPLVLQHCQQAELLIAGRHPSGKLHEVCSKTEQITIIPDPDDMAVIVQKADYYICPIHAGSGLKLRIFDGLKQGKPILCHDISAAGYEELAANGYLFSYHDETTFSLALRQLTALQIKPEEVYQTFRNAFSLQTGIQRLEKIIKPLRLY